MIIIAIILKILILDPLDFAKKASFDLFLNKKYDKYEDLFKNTTESENCKIIKLPFEKPRRVLFDRVTKNFILTGNSEYQITSRKINENGEEIDSLKIKGYLFSSGVYFYEDYCIDWAITGNKSKHKYDTIINYDSLSKEEFEDYLNKATIVGFTKKHADYKGFESLENHKGRCHLKIQDKWIVIESKKMFDELEDDYEKDYFELKHKNSSKKNEPRLITLSNRTAPIKDWKKEDNIIFLQKFKKESREREGFFFDNRDRRSGWNGTGYFQLSYNSEVFNFKSYAFESKRFTNSPFVPYICSFKPDISVYFPEKIYNVDIAFILSGDASGLSNQPTESRGIYVLKKK